MNNVNPPPRRGSLRETQAEATRLAIVRAAERRFLASGYAATTIEAVAADAGVAIQTIYNAVGNKVALLSAVLDHAAMGPEAPRAVAEFMRERAHAASDGAAVVDVLAEWFADVQPRIAPVFRVIREAAAVDRAAAALESAAAARRLAHYTEAAELLDAKGGLAAGLSAAQAGATIWAIGHPEAFRALVLELGWSVAAYRDWVTRSLGALLREAHG